ncbi:hypothetical protein BGZ76_007614 [Entomortierella beljakovae]|nr:hypothetical protein BGZ76_007614 [Entomortierella beljakovae]
MDNNSSSSTAQTVLPSPSLSSSPYQSEIVEFIPTHLPLPGISSTDTTNDVISPKPHHSPSFQEAPPEYSSSPFSNLNQPDIDRVQQDIDGVQQDIDRVQQDTPDTQLPIPPLHSYQHQHQHQQHQRHNDELPIYIPIAESNIPFTLLQSQSTTYTVISSQGLSEFSSPGQQSSLQEPQSLSNDTEPTPCSNHSQQGCSQVNNQQPTYTWTLEYWANDAISYLCYLMDPKFPKVDNNVVMDIPVSHNQQLNHVRANDASEPPGSVVELQDIPPFDHIRGRPPPLSRTRFPIPRQSGGVSGFEHHGQSATTNQTIQRSLALNTTNTVPVSSGSQPVAISTLITQPQNQTLAEIAPSVTAQEEPSIIIPIPEETLSNITSTSQQRPFGTLPSIQHVPINDGYLGEEADTILAHAMDIRGAQDTTVNAIYDGTFNNALSPEFLKSPSFALVSAEDPQTWLWWSIHHATKLQECKQESPRDVVTMWWRTRVDFNTPENKEWRKQLIYATKQKKKLAGEKIGLKQRLAILLGFETLIPHSHYVEVSMRLQGKGYAWREEVGIREGASDFLSGSDDNLKSNPRVFTLSRDGATRSGQSQNIAIIAQVWIEGESDSPSPSNTPTIQPDTHFSSSFPAGLRKRRCIIRIANGVDSHVETYALSTGPKLIEIFDTEKALPGPSSASFQCILGIFSVVVMGIFIGNIYVKFY